MPTTLPITGGHVDVTMPCGTVYQLNRHGVATRTVPDPHLPGWGKVLFPGWEDDYRDSDVIAIWKAQARPCTWCGNGREPVLSTEPASHEGGLWPDQTLLLCAAHAEALEAAEAYPERWVREATLCQR